MVAEVKSTTSGVVSPATQRPAASETAQVKPPVQTGQAGGEHVNITSTAAQLRDLEKAVKAAPDVDTERVNRLRDAIADGSYKVDNDKLAQNILRQEMMMMAPTKGVEKEMSSAKDRLLELTGTHIRLLTELDQVLDAEAAALGKRQLTELQAATDRKSELLAQIEAMSQEFTSLCAQIGVHPQKGGLTGTNVTAVMADAWGRMCGLLEQCEKKNRINGVAINASRKFAENLLSLLRGQVPTSTYGRTGAVYGSAGAKALGSV